MHVEAPMSDLTNYTKNDGFYEKNSLIYIEIVINFKKNSISCINMYVFWT